MSCPHMYDARNRVSCSSCARRERERLAAKNAARRVRARVYFARRIARSLCAMRGTVG